MVTRNEVRGDDGEHHRRHREAADEIARAFGHEDDGQEGQHEGWRCSRARRARSDCVADRRVAAFVAVAQEALDILHDHDAVVHQQSRGAMIIPTVLSWLMVKPKG